MLGEAQYQSEKSHPVFVQIANQIPPVGESEIVGIKLFGESKQVYVQKKLDETLEDLLNRVYMGYYGLGNNYLIYVYQPLTAEDWQNDDSR